MRLVVKQSGRTINKSQFAEGPIRIGRQTTNNIILPDKSVSKQHAIIFTGDAGKWLIEDMGSANKTYLNDKVIQKTDLKSGDIIRISSFSIEVNLEVGGGESIRLSDTLQLEASLSTPPHEILVRRPDAGHAPAMRLPAKRLTEFSFATESICKAKNLEGLLETVLDIMLKQFKGFHVWAGLRDQTSGPMTCQMGKKRGGKAVELNDLKLTDKINESIEKGQFFVLPRVSAQIEEKERIRSAIIAAIMRPNGCYGVLYVDNAMVHEHYSLSDLDYLMLVAIHTAAVLKKLLNL
ncbi:MAG: FHA domain-containing protein [Sedimentisphaerales bacterium]|nr:FHA domain-containing protein [Sedimentisphaerales bacterium]